MYIQNGLTLRSPTNSPLATANYKALMAYLTDDAEITSFTFSPASFDNLPTTLSTFASERYDNDLVLVQATQYFWALISRKKDLAYIEAYSSQGNEQTANNEVARAMLDLQWAVLEIVQHETNFIINTENLMVPRSANITSELDKVRADKRLKSIMVLWSPSLLQGNSGGGFTGRDRLTLTAVKFINVVYSMRKSEIAPVLTFNDEHGLQQAITSLAKD